MQTKYNALKILKTLRERKDAYDKLNKKIIGVMGRDYPVHLEPIDPDIENELVKLLDFILGDEIASYFLYECNWRGGMIIETDKVEWPIKTIADVKRYVFRTKGEWKRGAPDDYIREFIQQIISSGKPYRKGAPQVEGFGFPGEGYTINFHSSGTINITFDKGKFK